MDWIRFANRFTGFSLPLFGLSWNPPKLEKQEKQIAEKGITYLEDRRVLFDPYELEFPRYRVDPVLKIKEFLTEQLYDVDPASALSPTL